MRLALIVPVFALAVAASACDEEAAEGLPPEKAAELLENRNWMDRMPESSGERLHVYRFTPAMGGGVYQDRTLFAGEFELFTYEVDGELLRIEWPHRDLREEVRFAIERVDGPEPFDLRLRLEDNATGPSVYYGQSGEHRGRAEPLFSPLR